MSVKISGGAQERGVVVGNTFNKYDSSNPLIKWMMRNFQDVLDDFLEKSSPSSIHEVGCGEGFWVLHLADRGFNVRGTDFSECVISLAKKNAFDLGEAFLFEVRSIYELNHKLDSADLIVCCEVLEHLNDPALALQSLQRVVKKNLIISVPREPLWRFLNIMRLKYVLNLGNTPGHIQHWSKKDFIKLISSYFDVVEVRSPVPWTMLLCRPLK